MKQDKSKLIASLNAQIRKLKKRVFELENIWLSKNINPDKPDVYWACYKDKMGEVTYLGFFYEMNDGVRACFQDGAIRLKGMTLMFTPDALGSVCRTPYGQYQVTKIYIKEPDENN